MMASSISRRVGIGCSSSTDTVVMLPPPSETLLLVARALSGFGGVDGAAEAEKGVEADAGDHRRLSAPVNGDALLPGCRGRSVRGSVCRCLPGLFVAHQ